MSFEFLRISRVQEAWDYRSEPEAMHALATIFWRALLFIALIVLLFAFWFGYQELNAASQADNVQTSSSTPTPPFTALQLDAQLASFSTRQSNYQTLSQSALPSVSDPSK